MSNSKTRVTFQCSTDIKDALEACSGDREQTVSALIVSVLRDYLITQGYLESLKKQNLQPTQAKT
ncbi:hypothetical protein CK510_12155 [Brunnivagina elsteri CCALA 953]|uniref:CopG-like ribbon-helix-helix domain-containing protein n=1 Tax=Brunnivagina elsteri CCALA 953 TaxID=987040 RepID=A0A2A2TJ84_9CYAN|nr:hypothetical protein CK510_12155 [Calothrix elsteri CCALA 953]